MLFDRAFYLAQNPDVQRAGVDPWLHFQTFGGKEGRDANRAFDSSEYLRLNPDVARAGVNPLLHYLQFGQAEGRQAMAVTAPDRFLFGQASGRDRVIDFRPGEDTLSVLRSMNGVTFSSAQDVLVRATAVGADTVIDLGGGNTVTLVGVQPTALSAASITVV